MLYKKLKDYSIVSDYVKFCKVSVKLDDMTRDLSNLRNDLGIDSPFYLVAEAKCEQFKKDNADILKLGKQYVELSDDDKALITMAMGEIPYTLGECADFNRELNNTIERLKSGECDATTVKRLCKVVNDNFMPCKPYKEAGDTIMEAFKGMIYTGFKLGKNDPIKLKKRSEKQWTVQIMMYIYASCNQ